MTALARIAPQDRNVPWLGQVRRPTVPLKYTVQSNKSVWTEDTNPDTVLRYIDISSVEATGRISGIVEIPFGEAPSRARRRVSVGDVLISTVRTYLEAVALAREALPNLTASTGFAVLTAGVNLNPRFLYYWVRSRYFIDEVCARSTGVSYPAVNPAELGSLPVPLLPPDEQAKIADFLDRKMAAIDEVIRKKKRMIEVVEQHSRTQAGYVVGSSHDNKAVGLGSCPSGWQRTRVKYCFDFLDSKRIPLSGEDRANRDKVYPYYGASGIIDYVDGYIFDRDYVLFAEDGANLLSRSSPLAFVARGKYWVNNHAHILRPRFGNVDFWAAKLEGLDVRPWVSGSAQPKLTAEALGNIPLCLPPVGILEALSSDSARISQQARICADKIKLQVQALSTYRQALITAAVSGEIDVKAGPDLEEAVYA